MILTTEHAMISSGVEAFSSRRPSITMIEPRKQATSFGIISEYYILIIHYQSCDFSGFHSVICGEWMSFEFVSESCCGRKQSEVEVASCRQLGGSCCQKSTDRSTRRVSTKSPIGRLTDDAQEDPGEEGTETNGSKTLISEIHGSRCLSLVVFQ